MTTAFITGASRGIGFEIADGLAADGWDLQLVGYDSDRLEEAASRLRQHGSRVSIHTADVGDWEQVRSAVDGLVASLGVPELVINNAGRIDAEVPLWEADPEEWRNVVDTNLLGPFYVQRLLVPLMLKQGGGRVVNLVSGAGARDFGIFTAYTATKTALIRNTGDLHLAGYDQGLRAFGLAPGVVETDMTRSMKSHADRLDFTPAQKTVDMVKAVASGDLDEWSGAYLRVTDDSVETLQEAGPVRANNPEARSLGIISWGESDPLG